MQERISRIIQGPPGLPGGVFSQCPVSSRIVHLLCASAHRNLLHGSGQQYCPKGHVHGVLVPLPGCQFYVVNGPCDLLLTCVRFGKGSQLFAVAFQQLTAISFWPGRWMTKGRRLPPTSHFSCRQEAGYPILQSSRLSCCTLRQAEKS